MVPVGSALAVCVDAAFAVCAMIRLTIFGSSVGAGGGAAVKTGAHAMAKANAANQIANFVLRVTVKLFYCTQTGRR